MEHLKPKVAIIGCGNVGMRYAYALIIRGLARQIVMIDTDRKRLEGECMDLAHGSPYVPPVDIVAGDFQDIVDSDLVVITAGRKQEAGQSRTELVGANVALYRTIIPRIMLYAPSAIFLVVTNPVDILAFAAWRISKKPPREVIGSGTVLDTARFRHLLAAHCDIDPHNVHAYILGEHGDTEFGSWSTAMIGGVNIREYCAICKSSGHCDQAEELKKLFVNVRDSAYQIIERKQETSYGIGLALARITQAILKNENAILPVSAYVENYRGIEDLYLSLPSVINRNGVRQVLQVEMSNEELASLHHSADTLRGIIQSAGI